MAVTGGPKKGVQSPPPIGGLDFLDMDSLLKYPEIPVLDFLDTPPLVRTLMRSAVAAIALARRPPMPTSVEPKPCSPNAPASRGSLSRTGACKTAKIIF